MALHCAKLYKSIINDDIDTIVCNLIELLTSGEDINTTDPFSGQTIMHHIAEHIHKFKDPKTVSLLYLLGCKPLDLDTQDCDDETALHKVVRKKGAYRAMIALVRCGASMDMENKNGHTPEDILLKEKPDGWEEMLHWYKKFKPGLMAAVSTKTPDKRVIERLLKSWCRVTVYKSGKVTNLKCLAHSKLGQLDIVYLLEKYENTIEYALAAMAAVPRVCHRWKEIGFDRNSIDVNTKDHSYQYNYHDHPEVPQPLIAAVIEKDIYEVVDAIMNFDPDTNDLFDPIPDYHSPKPIFFHMYNGPFKPTDERIIHRIMKVSDLNARGRQGGTVLVEAIMGDTPDHLINKLFSYGINVAARARCGRTARDIAHVMDKKRYIQLIDDHVMDIIKHCNIERLECLILQAYDHILDITDEKGRNALTIARKLGSKQLLTILQNVVATQEHCRKVFLAIDRGNKNLVKKLLTKKYASALDKCSRTVLHHAILHKHSDLVRTLVEEYPQLVNKFDCLCRTPLHYANLFLDQDDTIAYLISKGANKTAKDCQGLTPKHYSRSACSPHEFQLRQKDVEDFDLEIFLGQTNFHDTFYRACRDGDMATVKSLTSGLNEHHAAHRFSSALFDCLDNGHVKIAEYMVKNGFSTDVWKQYEECDPDDPLCSMMECGHTPTSLRQRAVDVGAKDFIKLIDSRKGKNKHLTMEDLNYKCAWGPK